MPPPSPAQSDPAARRRLVDAMAQATRTVSDVHGLMQAMACLLGEHLDANRCAYATVEADQNHFELHGDYNRGVDSIVGRYAFGDFGAEVLRLMRAGEPYVNHDVDRDPRTAHDDLSAYRLTRIQSVVCVPLVRDGRFVAAMAVHQAAPRTWSADEVELVQTAIALCWQALEHLRAEAALRDAHGRLGLAMEAGALGDWSWDADTDAMALSPRAAAMFGLPPGVQVTRQALRDRLHPDDRAEALAQLQRSLAEGTTYQMEYRVLGEGRLRWVAVQGRPLRDKAGRVTGMIGIAQDVTARRSAEEAARHEAQLLEVLNRTGMSLASELDLQALLQRVTDAATQLTGARFGAFFYNGLDARGEALLLYTLSGADRAAFEGFGHPRPTAVFGPTFAGGAPVRCDDITTDPRYAQPPSIGMPKGHLPVRSYLGVPVQSRSGEVIGGLFFGHPEPSVFDARSERLAVGVAAQAAVAVDNARLFEQAQRDATQKRALLDSERAARGEAERASRAKDEFLATLSHELRTPLSAILGWTQVLRRKGAPTAADLARALEVIERSARVQVQLIDDLLDTSRITAGKLHLEQVPVALRAVLATATDAARPTADAAGVPLLPSLGPEPGPTVLGDAARLQQVAANLLSNAIKFSPRGAAVRVELAVAGGEAVLQVADAGAGIDPAFLPAVFDRFRQADSSTTRRYGGLGLGLAIVRQLVEAHGGSVDAASDGPGTGATFTVRLPLQGADTHPAAAPPTAVPAPALHGLHVLVVDDEADSREVLQRLLHEAGARTTPAAGAQEALALLALGGFDVLVSDIGMAVLDGYGLLRAVRQLPGATGSLPAVACTAFVRAEDRERARQAGFGAHVRKPVDAADLWAQVARVARRPPGGR